MSEMVTIDQVMKEITKIVDQYEAMLKEIVVKKGESFDCSPYTLALQALQKIIDKMEIKNDS